MLAKRIITCLDVKEGRTVKGVHFNDLKDAGDIVELAKKYSVAGADELVFLDITASNDNRSTRLSWVERVATAVDVPFTVGGGITGRQMLRLIKKGAVRYRSIRQNLSEPDLIDRLAYHFGKQCIVVAIDARYEKEEWCVYSKGGRLRTERELYTWALEVGERGAGEILFTSMDHDGTNRGFACEAIARLSGLVNVPVIASGGAGKLADFNEVFTKGKADAALAAGVFHYGRLTVGQVKAYLRQNGITVRG